MGSEVHGCASFLAGQLIRGEACVLTPPGKACKARWLADLTNLSQKYAAQDTSSSRKQACMPAAGRARQQMRAELASSTTLACQLADDQTLHTTDTLAAPLLHHQHQHPAVREQLYSRNRPDNHAPGHQSTVSGCGEVYEPRSRLMWSIVGKATSTQFEQPSRTVDEACLSTVQLPGIPSPSASAYRSSAACPAAGHISPAPLSTLPADAVVQCKQSFPDAAGDPDSAVSHHSLGPWGDLPPELVVKMALPLAGNAGQVIAMSGVCRAWRRVLAADGPFLQAIHFKIKQSHASQSLRGLHLTQPPWLAQKAAAAGNVSACVALASLLDGQGRLAEGMHYWGRAARGAYVEAQVRLGQALYNGSCGQPRDAEDALLWLSRASKQLLEDPSALAPSSSTMQTAEGHQGRPMQDGSVSGLAVQAFPRFGMLRRQDGLAAGKPLSPARLLSSAALLLGYLHFDGEAAKQDVAEAVRWFKVAAASGSREAENMLGTLFNTGQYG